MKITKAMKILAYTPLLLVLFFTSCIKNNPDPSWIRIEKWELLANPLLNTSEGELTHNFSDVWLYIDDKLIGVFELPVKIPVLISGNKTVKAYPAIRNNGISNTKKLYPFCEPYIVEVELIQNETISISPVTRYSSITKFWIEDFEDVAFKMETDINVSNANLIRTLDPEFVKYGNGCGYVKLTVSDSLWLGYTNGQIQLPKGKEVYWEIDYRLNNPVLTGVLGISSSEVKNNPYIRLNPEKDGNPIWKKIYLDLREIVSFSSNAEYYEMYLRAEIFTGLTEAEICIDNIKLVYF
jgi:hypothetical protein